MGGNNSPYKTIEGVSVCKNIKKNKDFILHLFLNVNLIKEEIKKYNIDEEYINIILQTILSPMTKHLTAVKSLA